MEGAALNTDTEIWRRVKDDFYSPSIHVTINGGIGIDVGGHVIVLPVEDWHKLAAENKRCVGTSTNKPMPKCPACGRPWDMEKYNACECGAVISVSTSA